MKESNSQIDAKTIRTVKVDFNGGEELWVVANGVGEYAVHAFLFDDTFETFDAAQAMCTLDAMRDEWLSLPGPAIHLGATIAQSQVINMPNLFGRWRAFEPPIREEVAAALEMRGING